MIITMNLQKQQQLQLMQKNQHTPLKQDEGQNIYKQSRYRYINFTIYCLAALVNSLPAQTFSSINSLVSDRFQYDQILVTLNTLFFPILHPIFAFPVNWILDKFGMRIGCTIGAILLVAGVWMRTFLQVGQVFWCLGGSALAAIGNIFVLNSPSILANNWFKPQSIPGVISFAVLANLISLTFGSGIPGLILDVKTSTVDDIKVFLKIQAIIITIPMILMVLGLRSRPKNPPSKSAENQQKSKQNFKQTMQKLIKNREYMILMIIMTLAYGGATSYLANMEQCLKSLDYSRSTSITSQVVLSAMFAGIVSSFFVVKKIKSTLQYKSIMCISLLGTTIIFTLLQLVLLRNPQSWASISIGVLDGIFMIPTTSIFLSYSSQVIYPLGEGSATGFLFASAQTFGFLAGMGSAALIKLENGQPDGAEKWYVYIFMIVHILCFFGAFVATLFTKNTLNRTKYQKGTKKLSQIQSKFIFSAVA